MHEVQSFCFPHPYWGRFFATQANVPFPVSHLFWSAVQPAVYGSVPTTNEHAAPGRVKTRNESTILPALRVKLDTVPPIQALRTLPWQTPLGQVWFVASVAARRMALRAACPRSGQESVRCS